MRKLSYRLAAAVLMLVVVLVAALAQPLKSAQAEVVRESKVDPALRSALASMSDEQMLTVIVTMRSQADLTNIQASGRQERIYQVINALQKRANATQLHLRALLEQKKTSGDVASYESFWVFNGLAVTAKAAVIDELATRPEIATITANAVDVVEANDMTSLTVSSTPELNLSVVGAPQLWDLGYTGQGIVVASMDSGVDYGHPDLFARWRGGNNSWFDPYGQHPSTPTDVSGHGTWTMGVMAGGDLGGTAIGLAPDAQWIAVKIFDDYGNATASAIHSGFQWLLDPDGDPATPDTPHVVNNSWISSSSACDLQFEVDLQALRAAGILPVFAAGNAGPSSGTSRSPANNPSAFAIGSTTNSDAIVFDSSRGPSSCGESESIFPEIVAPGVDIHTTDKYGFYTDASGTSLAAPHVSGGLALLLSAYGDLPVADQEAALVNSAFDLGPAGPDNDYGSGRLDVLAAYQWLQQNPPGATPSPTPVANANLALNRPVTVSSFEDDAHAGSYAVDGDTATFWKTARAKGKSRLSSESITVDLGADFSVGQVILSWADNFAISYVIRVSSDNSTWSPVYGTTGGDGGVDTISFDPVSARYFRLESTAWSNESLRNWLQELELYAGTGGQPSTATPTPSPTPLTTATPTPTPATPAPTPTDTPSPAGTMHVGDLDGSAVPGKRNRWDATVVVTIHDQEHAPVNGALVSGSWSDGSSGIVSCTTGSAGSCSLSQSDIKGNLSSIQFTVQLVQDGSLSYQPADDHDPDGDSSGSGITIAQP